MQALIQKWGNSLGVRIPKIVIEKLNFAQGRFVSLEIIDDDLVISLQISELDSLLDQINDQNVHCEEFNADKIIGKEIW